jgi:hypothetical protein
MKDQFIKKYWAEENTLFYLHFHNEHAIRQIEVTPEMKVYLSEKKPDADHTTLYDQSINDLDLDSKDFITQNEFEQVWSKGEPGEVKYRGSKIP